VNPFMSKWFCLAACFTIVGFTGSLAVMRTKNSQNEKAPSTLVSAISASRIQASGKPYIIYGTAWKEDQTSRLVTEAIRSGFRFIDTACQPKHYNEAGVGDGIVQAMKELQLSREDISIQTKFTPIDGQDRNRVPYDVDAPLEVQALQSVEQSLRNLRVTYIDSLVLHSPLKTDEETLAVWRVFEKLVDEGKVLRIGISNCYDFDRFRYIYHEARIKPSTLQNRFYSQSGFDVDLRHFCKRHNILYQSFWTLSANIQALRRQEVRDIAASKGLSSMTLMYAFMMTMGHTPLSGTTDQAHMMEDAAVAERIQGGEQILDADEMAYLSVMLGITEDEEEEEIH